MNAFHCAISSEVHGLAVDLVFRTPFRTVLFGRHLASLQQFPQSWGE